MAQHTGGGTGGCCGTGGVRRITVNPGEFPARRRYRVCHPAGTQVI